MHTYTMWLVLLSTLSLMLVAAASTVANLAVKKEYCATEKFDASCDPGHVILIRSATYGRMRPGRCIGGVSLGCQVDILGHLDSVCSGRTSCHLSINDLDMVAQPCAKDYKSYLEATHICVPALNLQACDSRGSLRLAGGGGYIVGQLSVDHTPLRRCAYSLEADIGQKVAVYLYRFSDPNRRTGVISKGGHSNQCADHVAFQDGNHRQLSKLCGEGSSQRYSLMYSSDSNILLMHTKLGQRRAERNAYFMIEFKAIGCPDIKPPRGGWTERTGNDLVVRCNTTGDIWYLTCQDNEWVGQIGNCTHAGDSMGLEALFGDGIPFQQGIALAVGVGIVVGAILGALLLLCVWTIRKGTQESVKGAIRQVEATPGSKTSPGGERSHYPSLLTQDRSGGDTAMYEYTHVWDPHFASLGRKDDKKNAMKLVPVKQSSQNSKRDACNAAPTGKLGFDSQQARVHVYETPRGANPEEESRGRSGDHPLYYDLDPEGRPDTSDRSRDQRDPRKPL